MSIRIISKESQGFGQFNGGEILENKPIGFPGEGGELKPYSNMFYWAHAWSDGGSTIGEHPHQGFEIMSYVLAGSIDHYDSKYKRWLPLQTGDVQIIRSGNGISHAERLNPHAHIFQIWIDPDLSTSLDQPASYDDYRADSFPLTQQDGMTVKTIRQDGKGMQLETPGIAIRHLFFEVGSHELSLAADSVHSLYLISGELLIGENTLGPDSFFLIEDEKQLRFEATEVGELFWIESPKDPGYQTYASRRGWA